MTQPECKPLTVRERMTDEAVRRVKGAERWKIIEDSGYGLAVAITPFSGRDDVAAIRAEFNRLAKGEPAA